MVKRSKKSRAPLPPQDREIDPSRVSAVELAPRRHSDRAHVGAVLIFIAAVIGPLMLVATYAVVFVSLVGRFDRRVAETSLAWPLHVLPAPLGMMLVVGAYRLTEGGRSEGISDELKAATRLSAVAYAVTLAILAMTLVRGDWIGYRFFGQASDLTRNTTEALLALAAARYFAQAGLGVAVRGGRWLAAAVLAAIVAGYVLTRTTHDDMFYPIQPRYAYLVVPINVVLWTGKFVIFGMLCRVLKKRAHS